jgi:hypothetical protein
MIDFLTVWMPISIGGMPKQVSSEPYPKFNDYDDRGAESWILPSKGSVSFWLSSRVDTKTNKEICTYFHRVNL